MNRFLHPVGLAAIAATLLFMSGCHSPSSAEAQQTASSSATGGAVAQVTAATPVRKTLRRECVQPGQIEAFEFTPLFPKLPCYVQELHVDIGDPVQADQLLVELFLPELKDELRQKQAALVRARAEIDLSVAAVSAAEAAVATAQANVSAAEAGGIRAEADVVRWQSQYTRISQLAAGGAVDRKLEDETLDALKAAEAARGENQAKVKAAKAAVLQSQADLAKAKANEAVARARHESAEADLSREKALVQYMQIRAPYAGFVTERNVNRGDFVQPASTMTARPLLTVADIDTVRVFVAVPEMDSPWVEKGRTAYVSVQALPGETVEGKVTRTSRVLGPNRTLRAEIDLPNRNGPLRSGMYATARIVLQERPDACVLPLSAIVREGKQALCWVIKGGQAARMPITLGLQVGNDVEVASGLKGDEQVVQTLVGGLQEGQPVEVVKPAGR
jgi:HlyD family secretion protein